MRRRDFLIQGVFGLAPPFIPEAVSFAKLFSASEIRLISALATVIIPQGEGEASGADATQAIRLLAFVLENEPGSRKRFRLGLKTLHAKLSPKFSVFSLAARSRRLERVWNDSLKREARFALQMIRQCSAIEFFTRREGRNFLNAPFRTVAEPQSETKR